GATATSSTRSATRRTSGTRNCWSGSAGSSTPRRSTSPGQRGPALIGSRRKGEGRMMTEQGGLDSFNPQTMVEYLADGAGSERKLRLFGCACCRQVWDLLTEDCFRAAVETAERFSDGQASSRELAVAKKVSGAALERNGLAGVTGPKYCALGS